MKVRYGNRLLKSKVATLYSLDIEPDDIDASDTVTFVWEIA